VTASPAVAPRSSAARRLPTVAVLTMTRDEGGMLRRWVNHYGNAVGRSNLLVLDDNSTDGSTTGLDCPVVPLPTLPGGAEFERTRMRMVNGFAQGLLACHDFVIFVDVDEFLIPDPARYSGLREFLAARRNTAVIAPVALNLVHHVATEKDLDPNRPVLEQRSFAKFVPGMCKPAIKQVPAPWTAGSHGISREFAVDRELFMIHLKFADRRHLKSTSAKRSEIVALDGRASKSNWRRGRELMHVLRHAVGAVDPRDVPEFDPATVNLDSVVVKGQGPRYRTRRQGQILAMRTMPLVRVPSRLVGTL
jgi:hypothetical protein